MTFEILEDRKVQLLLAGALIAYISLVNNNVLPSSVKNIVNNSYVKIAILMLIGLRANYDVMTAVLLAVAFVVTLNCANQTEGFAENDLAKVPEDELPTEPTVFEKKNFQGRFAFLKEGKDNSPRVSQVRSLFVPDGWTVVAYPKRRFKGVPIEYQGMMFVKNIKMKSMFVKKGTRMTLDDWDAIERS
jgi:hypothetical protein